MDRNRQEALNYFCRPIGAIGNSVILFLFLLIGAYWALKTIGLNEYTDMAFAVVMVSAYCLIVVKTVRRLWISPFEFDFTIPNIS